MKVVSAKRIKFKIAIDADKYLSYYRGSAQNIVVRTEDNKSLKFPASAIKKFLTHDGVFGLFEIQFDENNKLINIIQIN